MKSGLYVIRNTITNSIYIGSSSNIPSRIRRHRFDLNHKKHCSRYLQRSWDKYGGKSFIFNTILFCSIKDLLFYEKLFIDHFEPQFNTMKDPILQLHSKETKEKISRSKTGKKHSQKSIRKMKESHKERCRKRREKNNGSYWTKKEKKEISIRLKKQWEKGVRRGKFTKHQVEHIKNMLENGILIKDIAEKYNVSTTIISNIKNGKAYKND